MGATILVVDDEQAIRSMVEFTLSRSGFVCVEEVDADAAEARIAGEPPDLILLDWMLPGRPGIEVVRRVRANPSTGSLPIIMLTAKGEEADVVQALDAGADDYIVKPFSPKALVARINAVLRRTGNAPPAEQIDIDGLVLAPASRRVTADGAEVELGPIEFNLLELLMRNPDRVFTRNQLLEHAWPRNVHVGDRVVDVHISKLRKALKPCGRKKWIKTLRSAGYRFSPKPHKE